MCELCEVGKEACVKSRQPAMVMGMVCGWIRDVEERLCVGEKRSVKIRWRRRNAHCAREWRILRMWRVKICTVRTALLDVSWKGGMKRVCSFNGR